MAKGRVLLSLLVAGALALPAAGATTVPGSHRDGASPDKSDDSDTPPTKDPGGKRTAPSPEASTPSRAPAEPREDVEDGEGVRDDDLSEPDDLAASPEPGDDEDVYGDSDDPYADDDAETE